MTHAVIPYRAYTNEDFDDGFLVEDADGPVDLTGSEFVAQIRKSVDDLAVILEASTDNGMLVIADQNATGETGLVEWAIPAAVAATIPPGEYPFDILWIMPDGRRDNIGGGTITFERGITRVP